MLYSTQIRSQKVWVVYVCYRFILEQCEGFQIYGDCGYTCNPRNFRSKSKKKCGLFMYTLLRFFKFLSNFCVYFRHTCNPRDNYMHFTGYVLRHGDPPHFLWGKNLQCTACRICSGRFCHLKDIQMGNLPDNYCTTCLCIT